MRVVLRAADGEVDLEVAVHDPAATVADLAAALPINGELGLGLLLDGVAVAATTPLVGSGLRPGCEVGVPGEDPADPQAHVEHDVELLVVGGLAAGVRHALPRGRSTLGRDPACAVVLAGRTTSGRHATVEVRAAGEVSLADEGSTSGSFIDGAMVQRRQPVPPGALAAIGACLVRVAEPVWREPAVLGPPSLDGSRPLHRPPPVGPPLPVSPLAPPAERPAAGEAPRFGWAAALVPLVGGLVLARLVDPRLALFTLLGPAVLVGQWLEDRRRHRRRRADASTARHVDLASFGAAVKAASQSEARRRSATHPDPAALGREIEAVGCGLWSRRPGHLGFAEVVVGAGPALTWTPPTTAAVSGPAAEVLALARLPYGCPATLPLAPGGHLGIAGPRQAALAVARWVVLQLAAHHGPADLRIAVVCPSGGSDVWRWAAYLPHTAGPTGAERRLLAAGPAAAADLVGLAAAVHGPQLVVVVDGGRLVDGGGPAGSLIRGTTTTVTIAPSRRALPSRCTSVLELDGPDGWAHLTSPGAPSDVLLATGIDDPTARRWARWLAALADPDAADAVASPPPSARLLELLGLDEPSAAAVGRRWRTGRGASTPIGCTGGPDGPQAVQLDLVADGPHSLVAGTTGAGKSELLRSLVAGLAASTPPDRLAMLLVDYKGGAAFADAARLPHVVGVVTDLGPDEAARALHSLEAELRRREAVLAELGLRDLADHPAHGSSPAPPDLEPLPRLVVVVDELAALAAELPSFLDDLVQLAARGRSLGLHLVLATQRPGSVVSAAVRTNCAVRCCLRVPDEADALDVVGAVAPAHLDRRQAGRAFLRRGAGDLVEVQVALVGGRRPRSPGPVSVRPATFGAGPAVPSTGADPGAGDLAELVSACRGAAAEAGLRLPRPLWLPPLPPQLDATELPEAAGDHGGLVVGLVDDPGRQRRLPLCWSAGEGPLVALGSGAGPALALQAAARVAAARLGPDRLHVYGLDLATQGLASLADLPHVGALVRPGEHERLHRVIQLLTDELALRQASAGDPGHRGPLRPTVLLLVDGVAGLRAALDGPGGFAAFDALERVVVDGAGLGLHVAVAADRLAAVPAAWGAAASCRLAFRSGDPLDLLALGAGRLDQAHWPDGRCLDVSSALVAQVATGGWSHPARPDVDGHDARPGPPPIVALARRVQLADLLGRCQPRSGEDGLRLPLGLDGRRLGVAVARLRPGRPFLVCGRPGSGRTTALATVAASARSAGCDVVPYGEGLAVRLAARGASDLRQPPLVVLVDDAERVADEHGVLAELVAGRHAGAHLVAAAPVEAVRCAFDHWTADLRRAGAGVVLRPGSDLDADVLGIPLLPRWPVPLTAPGRGVLVSEGETCPVQLAVP